MSLEKNKYKKTFNHYGCFVILFDTRASLGSLFLLVIDELSGLQIQLKPFGVVTRELQMAFIIILHEKNTRVIECKINKNDKF